MSFLAADRLWLLALLPVLAIAYAALQRRRRRYALRFTTLPLLQTVAPRRPGWRRHVAAGLLVLTVGLLVTAFARPEQEVRVARQRATIVVVIDVSLSMVADDVQPTRLQAAQREATEFVAELPKTFNVALVSFAGTASILVSPTTDRQPVYQAIAGLQPATSTATGDAIFAALQAIKQAPPDPAHPNDPAPARIVLLSDGVPNVGRPVAQAVDAARAAGVPISTIAFGTPNGSIVYRGQFQRVPVDTQTMRNIAEATGGHAYTAASAGELKQVYESIRSSVGFTRERREVTDRWVGFALLAALGTAAASLGFFGRLP